MSNTLREELGGALQIDRAPNYAQALEAMRNETYELISVDLAFPDDMGDPTKSTLPGMLLLKEIRRNPRNMDCGIIILSANSTVARVRQALRIYKVYDFQDKYEFDEKKDEYVEAAKSAIRGALLQRAAVRVDNSYQYSVTFDEKSFIKGELVEPDQRLTYHIEHPSPVDFADLARRADELNQRLANGDYDTWRVEARSIGKTLFKALAGHLQVGDGFSTARVLASKRPSRLSLQFSGPPEGLSFPFELMSDGDEYLALKHVITRRVEGAGNATWRHDSFLKFVEALLERGEAMRILIVGADSDGMVPGAEEEAVVLARYLESRLSLLGIHHRIVSLAGEDATVDRVKDALRNDFHLFHYAGHATYDDALPERSPVILRDGDLTASDLKMLFSETELRLVFLSCCLGGRNAAHPGRGDFHSFLHALSQAGTPVLVGHRWVVGDDSAANLALHFYRILFRDFCPGQALLRARQNCAVENEDRRDDASWASPILLMDG